MRKLLYWPGICNVDEETGAAKRLKVLACFSSNFTFSPNNGNKVRGEKCLYLAHIDFSNFANDYLFVDAVNGCPLK